MNNWNDAATSPRDAGYRMPAEWRPHAATWISWPLNRDTWFGHLEEAEAFMVEVVTALVSSEPVHINVLDAEHEAHVRRLLKRAGEGAEFFHIPTNDAWCRDHGPTFVTRDASPDPRLAVKWGYNAWGGRYPPFDLDEQAARSMASAVGVPRFEPGIILEGGALETNGEGVLLTTASCVLNPNRNPGLAVADAEDILKASLGVHTILWVSGELAGDETDGHIDNLARFVTPTDILMVVGDERNHPDLASAFERLRSEAAALPEPLRVHPLPLPRPLFYGSIPLPASYANFYIANHLVLVPQYGGPGDAEAVEILSSFFPDRRIVGIDCYDVLLGGGSFHCLTQQLPGA